MRLRWRDIAVPTAGVGITALGGVIAGTLTDGVTRVMVIGLFALAALALVAAWSAQRSARLARINIQARRMLSPDHASWRDAGAGVKLDSPDFDEPDDEVSRLRETLGQLGTRLAAQVKESAKKTQNLETLLDTIADPLVATDADDEVLLCNAAMERFAGAPRATLLKRPVRGLFTRPEVLELFAKAKAGASATGRVALTTEQGQRTFEVTAAPLPAAWGSGVFGVLLVLRDITDLSQAVRMQKDFIAAAGHELRTPIAAIKMATETLQDVGDDAATRTRFLGTIESHTLRLEELVRDLMDLSRLETADVPVNIENVSLAEVEATLRREFEPLCTARRLTLAIDFDAAPRTIETDPRLLTLILRNLVDNATKFAREGTAIEVVATNEAHAPAWASSDSQPAESTGLRPGLVRFEVLDRGIGIPLAHQDRVWDRFFQVEPSRTSSGTIRRGSGLGLTIVKQSAEALGGRVGLESAWGEGTRVWVEVPAVSSGA